MYCANVRPALFRVIPLLTLLGLMLIGCSATPSPPPVDASRTEQGSELFVIAEWDDVPAAVETASSQAEMALEATHRTDERMEFTIRLIGGERATLVAVRTGESSGVTSSTIRLIAKVGAFGAQDAERRLLGYVVARLRQLHGVEWAPR